MCQKIQKMVLTYVSLTHILDLSKHRKEVRENEREQNLKCYTSIKKLR
jgi:hypothetical protein